jgi:hypothetical protein
MTRRYLATTFSIAVAGALAIAACSTDDRSSYEKALALSQEEPERQFLQERIRQLK